MQPVLDSTPLITKFFLDGDFSSKMKNTNNFLEIS